MRSRFFFTPLVLLSLSLLTPRFLLAACVGETCYSQPITIGLNNQNGDFSLVRASNAGWVRVTFVWKDINPSNGSFNWNVTDPLVTSAETQGLKILAILSTAPVWAGSNANGTTPPSNIAYWETFVRKVAQKYAGRIDAYEIWNEPNLWNDRRGVGWNLSHSASPRYADYVHAAAVQIRTYAPGTLVVAPGTSSRTDSRTTEVFRQLEQVTYPDGPASSFVDVVSFHANGHENDTPDFVGGQIYNHLTILRNDNPSNQNKPVWVTEFGWKSNVVGEGSQKDYISQVVEGLTGSGYIPFGFYPFESTFKLTHAFIYKDVDDSGSSQGVYRINRTEKQVVTYYLHTLPYPAKHPNDLYFPYTYSCSGRTCTFTSQVVDNGYGTYDWDFGDGTAGTFGKVVTHTFPAAGRYFVFHGTQQIFPSIHHSGSDVQMIRVN